MELNKLQYSSWVVTGTYETDWERLGPSFKQVTDTREFALKDDGEVAYSYAIPLKNDEALLYVGAATYSHKKEFLWVICKDVDDIGIDSFKLPVKKGQSLNCQSGQSIEVGEDGKEKLRGITGESLVADISAAQSQFYKKKASYSDSFEELAVKAEDEFYSAAIIGDDANYPEMKITYAKPKDGSGRIWISAVQVEIDKKKKLIFTQVECSYEQDELPPWPFAPKYDRDIKLLICQ